MAQSTPAPRGNEESESNPDLKGLMLLVSVLRDIKDSLNGKGD